MKSNLKDSSYVGEEWDFWFDHTEKLPKKTRALQKQSYCFILNVTTDLIEYISSSITDVLGCSPEEFTMQHLFSIIHPDDLDYCRKCEYEGLKISNELYFQEHYRCSFHYSYRVKAKNEKYITIQQQYQTIEVDEYGHMLKTLVIHQKIDNYSQRPSDDFKVFDKSKNRSLIAVNKFKLTKRELQVLELVQAGFSSVDIAEKLFVSKLTIDTHRKNILNKTKSNSLLDLINKTGVNRE